MTGATPPVATAQCGRPASTTSPLPSRPAPRSSALDEVDEVDEALELDEELQALVRGDLPPGPQ